MRRTRTLTAMAAVGAAVILIGGSSALGATKTVEVGDDFFSWPSAPDTLKIKQGTTIDFDWIGVGRHDVYSKPGNPGKEFNSGFFEDPGVNFSKKFKKPGSYELICTTHQPDGMVMDLKVKKRR